MTMQQPQLLGNHFDHKVAWWEATFLQTDVTQHKLSSPIIAIEIYFINVNRLIANMVQSELVCTSDCNPTTTSLFVVGDATHLFASCVYSYNIHI